LLSNLAAFSENSRASVGGSLNRGSGDGPNEKGQLIPSGSATEL
jgi:hypothetical protein